jgi:hypothetical protein
MAGLWHNQGMPEPIRHSRKSAPLALSLSGGAAQGPSSAPDAGFFFLA